MYYEMFVLRNHENYFSEKNRASMVNWVVVSEFNSVGHDSFLFQIPVLLFFRTRRASLKD
jgi:hypothetical protein